MIVVDNGDKGVVISKCVDKVVDKVLMKLRECRRIRLKSVEKVAKVSKFGPKVS